MAGETTQPMLILVAVLIISILGIILIWEQTKPTLQTSLEGSATFVSHILASYMSGLSTVEQGKIEKNLNGSFDMEIGTYPWSKRTFTSIKPLSNYYIKVTAYDEKWERKRDSGQIPFVGELSVTCGGSGIFKATKCTTFNNISFITLLKEPNKPVELLTTQTFTITPVSVPNDFIARYSVHEDTIENSVKKYDFSQYYDEPEALIAGLISQESRWDEEAISPCGAAGIMQFVPVTARNYTLNVPVYPYEECNMQLCGKKVSSCNACTPLECDPNDERFDPEKAIEAGVHLLYDNILRCGSVEGGLRMYNSGKCHTEANPGYVSRVMGYAEEWKKYLA
ncbi:MAG: transglycosylase SLT domain-containing protein [Candidatus Aenigmarchaeota archaeon]|nr:transglycosylase SLT domain-containing protein [Candidatus Aenigmarchaeota archaeon]